MIQFRNLIEAAGNDAIIAATALPSARLKRALRNAWREQAADLIDRVLPNALRVVDGIIIGGDVDRVGDALIPMNLLNVTRVFDLAIETSFAAGAAGTALELGAAEEMFSFRKNALQYVKENGMGKLGPMLDETTKARMVAAVTQSIEDGGTFKQLTRDIRNLFEEMGKPTKKARAEMIAHYELGNAYQDGILKGGHWAESALGSRVQKYWLTVGDERVDQEECAPNETAGWIAVDQAFPSGHMRPLAHPRCRCTILMRVLAPGT